MPTSSSVWIRWRLSFCGRMESPRPGHESYLIASALPAPSIEVAPCSGPCYSGGRFDLHKLVELPGELTRARRRTWKPVPRVNSPENMQCRIRLEGLSMKELVSVNRKLIRPSLSEIQEQMS